MVRVHQDSFFSAQCAVKFKLKLSGFSFFYFSVDYVNRLLAPILSPSKTILEVGKSISKQI
ncbi:MAG: hypothetical protein CK425_08435 [Parachlamydia sp.]|nr:MAG: hypothetical protein CK425_08435 [Parachlamydia sp.]